jgi:hypothetical protein
VELRRASNCVAVVTISCVKVEVMGAMVVLIGDFNFHYVHFPLLFVENLHEISLREKKENRLILASFTTGKH